MRPVPGVQVNARVGEAFTVGPASVLPPSSEDVGNEKRHPLYVASSFLFVRRTSLQSCALLSPPIVSKASWNILTVESSVGCSVKLSSHRPPYDSANSGVASGQGHERHRSTPSRDEARRKFKVPLTCKTIVETGCKGRKTNRMRSTVAIPSDKANDWEPRTVHDIDLISNSERVERSTIPNTEPFFASAAAVVAAETIENAKWANFSKENWRCDINQTSR
ncbi:unnamed protein product [Acanthosepion pharaonis]|uniref:Uncharacterized protein n=1 Tax=Acanthosepion pharaonis TaxID=158019 RepID=A0A812BCV8_ACAPH|nr:unnamed protein product [Sepia pharaonis]